MSKPKLQREIDNALETYRVQPVGNGYIDCICPLDRALEFIDAMTALGVRVTGFSEWCHVKNGHEPCGMGGPRDKYGDGWYSEIKMGATYDFPSNAALKSFLVSDWPKFPSYKPCFVPGFWLDVPKNWRCKTE